MKSVSRLLKANIYKLTHGGVIGDKESVISKEGGLLKWLGLEVCDIFILEISINRLLGGIMVSLIFLEGLEEEAVVEFMVELFEEDKDGKKNENDGLFNWKANDQSRKA
ncbi:hypothetical protein Tco_0241219 [Tanacetum coccineum]